MGFGVWGVGFGVLWFGVLGLGSVVWGLGLGPLGLGCAWVSEERASGEDTPRAGPGFSILGLVFDCPLLTEVPLVF